MIQAKRYVGIVEKTTLRKRTSIGVAGRIEASTVEKSGGVAVKMARTNQGVYIRSTSLKMKTKRKMMREKEKLQKLKRDLNNAACAARK